MAAARRWFSFRNVLILCLLGFIAVTWLVGLAAKKLLSLKMGAVHTYALPTAPRFLTDSLAVTKARQTLDAEGYDKLWKPVEAGKTSDPDGNRDPFFVRAGLENNSGTILFNDSRNTKRSRIVKVELKANRVECQVQEPP